MQGNAASRAEVLAGLTPQLREALDAWPALAYRFSVEEALDVASAAGSDVRWLVPAPPATHRIGVVQGWRDT